MAEQSAPTDSDADVLTRLETYYSADAGKPETPPEKPSEQQPEASASAEVATEQEPEQEPPQEAAPELVELQAEDGTVHQVPQWVKDGFMRRDDYTRKTQEASATYAEAATQAEIARVTAGFQQFVAPEAEELAAVERQMKQYKAYDVTNLSVEDSTKLRWTIDGLKDRAEELKGQIEGKKAQFAQFVEGKREELKKVRAERLAKAIKGWGTSADVEATQAAMAVGFTEAELKNPLSFDARTGVLAWKAAQYDKITAGKPAAAQKVAKAPPIVRPGATQSGQAVATNRYKDARASLKKSGSVEDFARALLSKPNR